MTTVFAWVCAVAGVALIVAGIAAWSLPAASIVAGVSLIHVARVAARQSGSDV